MAPLILHNVPDDECYIGEDGVKRPYAMIFNQQDGPSGSTRSRRAAPETGSFGKSTRRSRSRTGTPARGREDPTLAVADKLFGDWVTGQQAAAAQQNSSSQAQQEEASQQPSQQQSQQPQQQQQKQKRSQPTEVLLRGYRSTTQQYSAVAHFESLAGTILEDYPREPPASQRRYKSQLRDPAFTRKRNLSRDELALVNRADGGDHWVKVTFESSEAAETAIYASPQRILGHLVYAEAYRGMPPAKDEACPDLDTLFDNEHERAQSMPALGTPRRGGNSGPTSWHSRLIDNQNSPSQSQVSSQTLETGTISSATATEATPKPRSPGPVGASTTGIEPVEIQDDIFCRRIPTARRARLLPAEQALRPQQSVAQRFVTAVPFLSWFGGSIIGNEVPRTETGEFDWNRASLYWKIMWWLDATFGLFKGDVSSIDKDD